MKKEAMNLKESREGYMEGARGGKGREKHCNEITISNINNNKNTSKPKSTWKKRVRLITDTFCKIAKTD